MNIEEVIKNRRSIRKFQKKEIEKEKVNKILELALCSPSARNRQARKLIIIKDKDIIKKIAEIGTGQTWISNVPLIITVCADLNESDEILSLEDATIFGAYLQLAAVSEGLSTCWVGGFDKTEIIKLLHLPDNLKPVVLFPLGYSDENPPAKIRKSLRDIIYKYI